MLRLKIKLVGFTEVAQRLIVFLSAGLQIGIRQIGQAEHQGFILRQHRVQLRGILGNTGFQLGHLREDGSNVLAGLLQSGNFLGNLVLTGLPAFRVRDQRPALLVQLQDPIHGFVAVHFLGPQRGFDAFGVFFDAFDV